MVECIGGGGGAQGVRCKSLHGQAYCRAVALHHVSVNPAGGECRIKAIDALFHDGRDERARWRDDYDNSIRHTDRVLATLIEALEARQEASALLYLSDHGQLLPHADCDKRWHGHGAVDDVFAAALVWLSAHANWHEARAHLGTHARRKTQGKEVFQTVLDAGGIELRGQGRLSSWLKGDYQSEPRIVSVLGRFVDADSEPTGGCLLLQAMDKALSLSGDVLSSTPSAQAATPQTPKRAFLAKVA
jgi:arylsulfatase A-like enzyme